MSAEMVILAEIKAIKTESQLENVLSSMRKLFNDLKVEYVTAKISEIRQGRLDTRSINESDIKISKKINEEFMPLYTSVLEFYFQDDNNADNILKGVNIVEKYKHLFLEEKELRDNVFAIIEESITLCKKAVNFSQELGNKIKMLEQYKQEIARKYPVDNTNVNQGTKNEVNYGEIPTSTHSKKKRKRVASDITGETPEFSPDGNTHVTPLNSNNSTNAALYSDLKQTELPSVPITEPLNISNIIEAFSNDEIKRELQPSNSSILIPPVVRSTPPIVLNTDRSSGYSASYSPAFFVPLQQTLDTSAAILNNSKTASDTISPTFSPQLFKPSSQQSMMQETVLPTDSEYLTKIVKIKELGMSLNSLVSSDKTLNSDIVEKLKEISTFLSDTIHNPSVKLPINVKTSLESYLAKSNGLIELQHLETFQTFVLNFSSTLRNIQVKNQISNTIIPLGQVESKKNQAMEQKNKTASKRFQSSAQISTVNSKEDNEKNHPREGYYAHF